jgi:hypothetical protein
MFAVPNIEVRRPIEVDGFAVASIHDARVHALAEAHPNFQQLLSRFTTEFGQPIIPSVFICRDDAPITPHSDKSNFPSGIYSRQKRDLSE